ncbi:hypothetical protein [Streptosporangium roseum]|uniref:Uncharacterized protein n=1 Tax=Streptosporangium roseum (strain ATCC 12428 / DSM 43021 / JCM 3005 / KCTC 9067 / NCIMB 10171 / NRRL 2505 / NI 9100) TaxID=479432 RepID=D2ART1_STRRD|nr:hypothetical protein [Streptosporangium roseum]ACZ84610.1 hypothetical protein Sros_1619 [Streptosporangium roseum DSM 43021]
MRRKYVISFDSVDDDLRAARDRVRRLEQLTRQRQAVAVQLDEVGRLIGDLEAGLAKEERDVSRLEGGGFAAFLAGLAGSKEEKLARERAEAQALRQRLDGQRTRLGWLQADRAAVEDGLAEVAAAREEFAALLERKERSLVESADPRGRELAEIGRRLADTHADLREHEEAHLAGVAAGQAVGQVLRCLGGARGASTWDMLGGGGFADMVEHGHMRDADEAAWHAQRALDAFSRELADVGVHVNPQLPEVDTRWFADVFFDNIITDAIKHQRIARTGEAVTEVARWVSGTVDDLAARRGELARHRDSLAARREDVLTG